MDVRVLAWEKLRKAAEAWNEACEQARRDGSPEVHIGRRGDKHFALSAVIGPIGPEQRVLTRIFIDGIPINSGETPAPAAGFGFAPIKPEGGSYRHDGPPFDERDRDGNKV